MDIVLHLGAHHCATTAFQDYLWHNRVALSSQGLTSWTPRRTRDGLLRGLVRHPALISVQDERDAIRSIGRMRVEFARLRKNGQNTLLMSDDAILGSAQANLTDTRLYALLSERLMRFRPAFDCQELTIALSIRSYDDYWTSCLADQILRGGAVPNADALDYLTTQPRRWRAVIRDIAAVFPSADLVVSPFERFADQPDAQLRAIWPEEFHGLKPSQTTRSRAIDIGRLNKTLARRGASAIKLVRGGNDAEWMPFDEDQRNVLRAEYRRDLAWLASGAEGLVRFVDTKREPTHDGTSGVHMLAHGIGHESGSGRSTPAPQPDRADVTRTAYTNAVLFGGRYHGIEEEKLGRTGPS